MFSVLTNNANNTFSLDDFTLITDFFYRGKNMLEKVDCAKDPEVVLEEIEEILGLA